MIPRTKVNYNLADLLWSLAIAATRRDLSQRLISKLAEILDQPHVTLTSSGRGALYLLLRALPQPIVIVPAYTCKAVVEAVHLANKRVVFVDAAKGSFNMDSSGVAPFVGADTIVLATHQFGIPCQIEALAMLCQKSGAFLVEDAAASFGTRVNGRLTGTFGDAAFFSFDSTKLVTVPLKGGFLTIRDAAIFQRVKEIQARETRHMPWWHGAKICFLACLLVLLENHFLYRVFHTIVFKWRNRFTADSAELDPRLGEFYRYRLTEWQAYLGLRQIERFEDLVRARRRIYAEYRRRLSGGKSFELPPDDEYGEWACIRFPILVRGDKLAFYARAADQGIDFAFSFSYVACPSKFQHAHHLAAAVLDLPFYYKLSQCEMDRVVSVLHDLDGRVSAYVSGTSPGAFGSQKS